MLLVLMQVDDWESDPADVDLYDRDDVDFDGQYSSGRKRRLDRESVALDMDSFSRKSRRPKMETEHEINQRMLSVELAIKEALAARGEKHFTDQEFPPNSQSLFVDPENPSPKLQVRASDPQILGAEYCSCFLVIELTTTCSFRSFLSG